VPQNLCCRVPEGAPLEAACYATVGSIALHGVRQAEVRLRRDCRWDRARTRWTTHRATLKASGCRVLGSTSDPAAV
jgi:hypothetical protein